MPSVNIVLYHDYEALAESLEATILRKALQVGLELEFHNPKEYLLQTAQIRPGAELPPNSIIITHGRADLHHQNVEYVLNLARQRPDVHSILCLDPTTLHIPMFQSDMAYHTVKMLLEREFHAQERVSVTTNDVLEFISGRCENTLEKYLTQWKELQ